MSSTPPLDPDELLAAELAFGLLGDEERGAAEQRRTAQPEFARYCARWEARAVAMLGEERVEPDPTTWAHIAAALPANDQAELASLRREKGWWRAAACFMTVVAVGCGLLAAIEGHRPARILVRSAPAATPATVVILTSESGPGVASVSIDGPNRPIVVASKAVSIGRHSAELWVIPGDGVPRPLGLLPARTSSGAVDRPVDWYPIAAGMTLAISLEPLGGSPTGKPTGPVILVGKV